MTLEWILKQNNIKNVKVDTSIAFAAMSGAFIGGTGDYVSLFEPTATQVEQQGYGYIVASLGQLGGVVPYTVYTTQKSYLDNNKDVIEKFTKAIQKGLDYTHSHSANELANLIVSYFPDLTINQLTTIIQRYIDNDSWFDTTYIEEENFTHLEEIMENAGQLKSRVPFDKVIDNEFSTK